MILIPKEKFIMGYDAKEDESPSREDESPQRIVTIKEFWVGKYLVTNQQYGAFIEDTRHKKPLYWSDQNFNSALKPVVGVSWEDAIAYLAWLSKKTGGNYRLPTEAEWEKAARGNDGRKFPWGNDWDSLLSNSYHSGIHKTVEVNYYEGKDESPYGIAGMIGNVWEWCSDWYHPRYYKNAPVENPQGQAEGVHKVIRGGAFNNPENYITCSSRGSRRPETLESTLGFRYVRDY